MRTLNDVATRTSFWCLVWKVYFKLQKNETAKTPSIHLDGHPLLLTPALV
jgi:hypothetical protein